MPPSRRAWDVIGISSHASNYEQIGLMLDLMKEKEIHEVSRNLRGGPFPNGTRRRSSSEGWPGYSPPQSTSESIVDYIVSCVKR